MSERHTDISRRAIEEGLAEPYTFHLGVTREIEDFHVRSRTVVHVWGERPSGESPPLAATSITAAALLEVGRADLAAHCMRQAPKPPTTGLDGQDRAVVEKAMLLGQLGQAAYEHRWDALEQALAALDHMRSPVSRNGHEHRPDHARIDERGPQHRQEPDAGTGELSG